MVRSGIDEIYSASIDSNDLDEIAKDVSFFWSAVFSAFSGSDVDYIRAELWADSGRVVCYGVGKLGEQRIGRKTFQVAINRLAQEWLEIEDLSDPEFEQISDDLNLQYVKVCEQVIRAIPSSAPVQFYDSDSNDRIFG